MNRRQLFRDLIALGTTTVLPRTQRDWEWLCEDDDPWQSLGGGMMFGDADWPASTTPYNAALMNKFADMAGQMGKAAADYESRLVADILARAEEA